DEGSGRGDKGSRETPRTHRTVELEDAFFRDASGDLPPALHPSWERAEFQVREGKARRPGDVSRRGQDPSRRRPDIRLREEDSRRGGGARGARDGALDR